MASNPVLARLMRNGLVENSHHGSFCISDDRGNVIAARGDVERRIFPRSAIKSMQALALFSSGAVERFGLDARDIAIASASHHGETAHVEAARALLEKIGCMEDDLQCGTHAPTNRAARNDLFAAALKPSPIHNNCSGKHAGMLAVAKALGAPARGYWQADHPVQQLVKSHVQRLIGQQLLPGHCAIDGCSIPTYAAPLKSFALGFARMASGAGIDREDRKASQVIFDAMLKNPFLVGGTGSFDSDAMEMFGEELVCKIGAEGVYCGLLPRKGLGFALKCGDGNMLAARVMVAAMLEEHAEPDAAQKDFLQEHQSVVVKNWRGLQVAAMVSVSGDSGW